MLTRVDLSEYNLLYEATSDAVFVIDVGQAVAPDHSSALEFLRADIEHIATFFRSKGVCVPPLRQVFASIVRKEEPGEAGQARFCREA